MVLLDVFGFDKFMGMKMMKKTVAAASGYGNGVPMAADVVVKNSGIRESVG